MQNTTHHNSAKIILVSKKLLLILLILSFALEIVLFCSHIISLLPGAMTKFVKDLSFQFQVSQNSL